MNNRYRYPTGLALMMTLSACGGGDDSETIIIDPIIPGEPVSVDFEVTGFSAVEVEGPFETSILQGTEFSVELTVNSTVVDALDVQVVDETLTIGFLPGDVRANTLEAVVVMPSVNQIELSGAAQAMFSGFTGNNLQLDLQGASSIEALNVRYDFVSVNATGASQVLFEDVDPIPAAHADVSGSSSVTFRMMDSATLTGSATAASTIFYRGENVQLEVSTDASSSVTRIE